MSDKQLVEKLLGEFAVRGVPLADVEIIRAACLDDLPPVCFVSDLARVLRCDERTISRLRKAQQTPTELPIPGRPRWARETVRDWIVGGGKGRRR